LNLQNLPRDGILRKTLRASPGHALVIAAFSQIEFRILMALAITHASIAGSRPNCIGVK
jgi:DNA polymerase I-like protein with 3'-5' exonuclease and polymerase domains